MKLQEIPRKAYESVITHPVAWAVGSAAVAVSVWGAAEVAHWVNEAFVQGNGFAPDGPVVDLSQVNG